MKAYRLTAKEVRDQLLNGNLAPEDYVEDIYERIEKLENRINAFITIREKNAVIKEVKNIVKEAMGGKSKALAGVLIAIKDNISTKGIKTTCASRILENYIPPYDATVIERLKRAGAVIVGKTNMDEFAMGSTGETSYFGPTKNPWDESRVPGGSSSGSAAALAAGFATLALGSDTGGSIRLPAAWTGAYGLKPTYGSVSRYGLIAYAESLEQIGPMARSVADLKLLYNVIAGWDPRDSTTVRRKITMAVGEENIDVSKIELGVLEDFIDHDLVEKGIKKLVDHASRLFEREGSRVEYVKLGRNLVDYSLPAYYIIAMAEASSNLARYDCIRYGCRESPRPWESWNKFYSRVRGERFGTEVKKRIMLGSWILSAGFRERYYIRALRLRRLVRDSLLKLLSRYNILLLPATITPPPRIGSVKKSEPLLMYLLDLATVIANLAGVPAMTIPVGYLDNIPHGIQLMSGPWREDVLFVAAKVLEDKTKMKNLTI